MAETVEKKERQSSLNLKPANKVADDLLPFEERMVRLRLKKSKERSFLLQDTSKK